jgi:glutamate carboxypeptidase
MAAEREVEGSARAGLPRAGIPADLFDDALSLLTGFAGESSSSDDAPGLHRMAARLAGELGARGLEVEVRPEPDEHGILLPVVGARTPAAGGPGRAPLLLIGHFDTVLPASTPRREGDRLVATGAIDMKGGIVMFLKALDLVARRGGRLPELRLVLVPDEEVGGAISRRSVVHESTGARALWVLEPGERTATGETLVTGRRGMFHWRLDVVGRSAHSGLAFWEGRSAVVAAADWIQRAAALSRPHGGPTVNTARLEAGGSSMNVVPDRAVAEGEARFLRAQEASELAEGLASLAREAGERHEVRCEFTRGASIPPVDPTGLPRRQAERAVELAAQAGWELAREEDRGGISFPNFLADPGRIPVLDGLGPAGGGMHTREEYVELESLARRIRLLADLLETEADGGEPVRPSEAAGPAART